MGASILCQTETPALKSTLPLTPERLSRVLKRKCVFRKELGTLVQKSDFNCSHQGHIAQILTWTKCTTIFTSFNCGYSYFMTKGLGGFTKYRYHFFLGFWRFDRLLVFPWLCLYLNQMHETVAELLYFNHDPNKHASMSSFWCELDCMISKFKAKTQWSNLSVVILCYIKCERNRNMRWMRCKFTLCQQVALMAQQRYSISLVTAVNKPELHF